ncbi:MAG: hypothetical protein FWB78_09330 [Treponema sp.]|nr:hypothetical protein [Treponema sp.]
MKVKINTAMLRLELRNLGLSQADMVSFSGINKNRWNYIYGGGFAKEAELQKIADILQCDTDLLIDADFRIGQGVPWEIERLVRKLYEKRRGDIQPAYELMMRDHQRKGKIEKFIGEANRLMHAVFHEDPLEEPNPFSATLLVVNDLRKDRIFSDSYAELDEQRIEAIFSVVKDSRECNMAQGALALFLYALVIFDAVFLMESIASVTQFTIERFGNKADQYRSLTVKTEILRDTLLKAMTEGDLKIGEEMEYPIRDKLLEGVYLMLFACHKVGQHLNGDYLSSEYVNRTELDAIITRLTRIITGLGIPVPDAPIGISGTRFERHLFIIRSLFKEKKPQKQQQLWPQLSPQEMLVWNYFMNNQNSVS